MAVSSGAVYLPFLASQLTGTFVDFDNDTIKVMLVTSGYTFDAAHQFRSSATAFESSGTNYTAGGLTITNVNVVTADPIVAAYGDNTAWNGASSAPFVFRGAIVYKDTGNPATDPLISYHDFGEDLTNSALTVELAWSVTPFVAYNTTGVPVELIDLQDVTNSTPTDRNVLVANGATWESRPLVEADISDLQTYLTTETNDLTAAVTWANVPDANITESSVTQHEAALSINESQVTFTTPFVDAAGTPLNDQIAVFTDANTIEGTTGLSFDSATLVAGTYVFDTNQVVGVGTDNYVLTYDDATGQIRLEQTASTVNQLSDLSDVNTSTPTNRHVLVADGVDWESRLLTEADISDFGTYLTTEVNDLGSSVVWADIPPANVPLSAVKQYESSLVITESQISDFGTYLENVVEDITPQLGGTLDANGNIIDMGTNTITDAKVGTWDLAFSWGDHSVEGYLLPADISTFISNVVEDTTPQLGGTLDANGNTIDMGINLITDTKVGQWDTAFGWGDHALAGYLTTVVAGDIDAEASLDGYVLTSDGLGNAAWEVLPPSGLQNIVEDTTPQLGGDLDANGFKITTDAPDATDVGLNLPHGTTPTTPVNGDIWTETGGIYVHINGSTEQLLPVGGGGISAVVDDPSPQLGGTLDSNGNSIDMGAGGSIFGGGVLTLSSDNAGTTSDLKVRGTEIWFETLATHHRDGSVAVWYNGTSGNTEAFSIVKPASGVQMATNNSGDFSIVDFSSLTASTITEATLGNYVLDTDQVVGPATDNYVLTYDDITGQVSLEANPAVTDHTLLSNIGVNTHAQIDTHIADTDIHFSDAPADAQNYVRVNNGWAVAPTYAFGEYVSGWDASAGTFPTAINQGDWFNVTVAGTVDGESFDVGDTLIALIDNPSTTVFAGNWSNVPNIGVDDHTLLTNIGTNTHAQIDSHITTANAHIADSSIHFTQAAISITESQISDLQNYLLNINGETLNALQDVVITSVADNEVLAYDTISGDWINQTAAEAGLATTADIANFLENVVEDTSPQLGGGLDTNGFNITSAGGADVSISPSGTGNILLGTLTIDADQTVGAGQDGYALTYNHGAGEVVLQAPSGLQNVVEDTTPQLGGTLDTNGFNITPATGNLSITTNNGSITIAPSSSLTLTSDGQMTHNSASGDFYFNNTTTSNHFYLSENNGTVDLWTADTNVDRVLIYHNNPANTLKLVLEDSSSDITVGNASLNIPNGLEPNAARKETGDIWAVGGDLFYYDGTSNIDLTAPEVNDLTAAVTWANVPDANITQSSVTQHQAALSITESQISDLGAYLENVVEDLTPQLGGTLDANGNIIDMGVNTITDTKVGQWDTAFSWGDHAVAGYLTEIVQDTTPQLGGDLDVNNFDIITSAGADINLLPSGTGDVRLGNYLFDGDQTVGPTQDGYVLSYDNGTGLIDLSPTATVLVATGSATNVASLDFTDLVSDFGRYQLVIHNVVPATDGADLNMQVSTNNGVSFITTANYNWAMMFARIRSTGGSASGNEGTWQDTSMRIMSSMGTGTGEDGSGIIDIFDPTSGTYYTRINTRMTQLSAQPETRTSSVGGEYSATTAVDAFRLIMSTGNIATIEYTLYGYRQ